MKKVLKNKIVESMAAKDYYGSHATGTVILVNGYPYFHGLTKEAKAFFNSITKRKLP